MKYPLITNNISRNDLDKVIKFLKTDNPILTNNHYNLNFEKKWSSWLGVKYSVFVNSGSSANLLTLAVLKEKFPKGGEIIVPSLTWSSDINSIIFNGFKPVFIDISFKNLSLNIDLTLEAITKKTVAVFITHAQGFNGFNNKLLKTLRQKKIILIEDVCESHGATFKEKKLGTFGLMSNFSFYYAHHMSTIEGGMISTNNKKIYNSLLMLRGHGLLRECNDSTYINKIIKSRPDLNPNFIFMNKGYNVRNNEIGGLIGLNQLKNLDYNINKRKKNFAYFVNKLDKNLYFTDFDLLGSSNYAFNLILKEKNTSLINKLKKNLIKSGIEFRMGSAGGGNQLRQPYLSDIVGNTDYKKYPITEHVHFYGMYIGNYPSLKKIDIDFILKIVNLIK
jgi:CDP-4-dehydro-6-deoxyglucose reductase, E1